MKILIVTMGYFPGERYGGPPVSVENFCELMEDWEHHVITKDHDLGETVPYPDVHEGWNRRGHCQVRYLSDADFGTAAFEAAIRELRPDRIYLQSLFQSCVISCLRLAKKYGIRVILAPRGELCKGAFRKKYKKLPYIALLRLLGLLEGVSFQSTSGEESAAIGRYLGAAEEDIHLLENIPSIPKETIAPRQKSPGSGRFLFLSRIHPKKNLLSAISYFREVEGDVRFDIYGPIEDAGYWDRCQAAIRTLPENIRVRYRGLVQHEQVHRIFSGYDAFLFPTLSENYGHVIVEAMSVGCPVIVSDQTPWKDMEAHGVGWAIPLGERERFTEAIRQVIAMDHSIAPQVREYLAEKLDLPGLRRRYADLFEKV